MYVEAIIVSVNYADILACTLPHNKDFFDNIIISTTESDKDTIEVCKDNDVSYITTNRFFENNCNFNLAKGFNNILSKISKRDWVIKIDGDILLPPNFREVIEKQNLKKDHIYGLERFDILGYSEYQKYLNDNNYSKVWDNVYKNHFNMDSEVEKYKNDTGHPYGFFQLWNPIVSGKMEYPEREIGSADIDDCNHSFSFDGKNSLITDMICYHLLSEPKIWGKDWDGRKTQTFKPQK